MADHPDLDAYIAAAAPVMGLDLAPAEVPDVRRHLAVILEAAAFVAALPLPDETEPAPVFVAGSR